MFKSKFCRVNCVSSFRAIMCFLVTIILVISPAVQPIATAEDPVLSDNLIIEEIIEDIDTEEEDGDVDDEGRGRGFMFFDPHATSLFGVEVGGKVASRFQEIKDISGPEDLEEINEEGCRKILVYRLLKIDISD